MGTSWGESDRFLALRDERPVLAERLAGLDKAFEIGRRDVSDELSRIVDDIETRLAQATEALAGSRDTLSASFAELPTEDSPDRRARSRLASELESQLAVLYRRVRLVPGRVLDGAAPRRALSKLLEEVNARHAREIDRFPEDAVILEARRRAAPVPAGDRLCDVHAAAVAAAGASRLPVFGPARRALTKFRIWSSYEVLRVPARDIARELVMRPAADRKAALVAELGDVHARAAAELEESWQIVRSNLDVAMDELQHAPEPVEGDGEPPSPEDHARELTEIVLGALVRAGEKIAAIPAPYRELFASIAERTVAEQSAVLQQVHHEMERSEDASVRLRWLARRLGARWSSWLAGVSRGVRLLRKRIARFFRRTYFRGEDAALRLGKALGLNVRSQETLLAFGEMQNADEVEENARSLPPVYRRLFSSKPLRTRELLVGREQSLATLDEVLERWTAGRPSSVAVVGPEGSGKTTLLNCFEAEAEENLPVFRHELERRVRSVEELVELVSGWFELDPAAADLDELARRILEISPRLAVVEGGHYLTRRAIGARRIPEAFLSLVLATRARILWIMTIRHYPWRRLDDLLNVGQYFTHTIETPFHSGAQLRDAILLRHRSSGLKLMFSGEGLTDRKIRKLLLSHPSGSVEVQEALQARYFENLFAATGGNMDAALFYWLGSVSAEKGGESLIVSPVSRPDTGFLSRFERLYLFTLSEILNHGTLSESEHAAIFRVDEQRSRVVLNYLRQLNLIRTHGLAAANEPAQYKINPVFFHLVSSTLETMRTLY